VFNIALTISSSIFSDKSARIGENYEKQSKSQMQIYNNIDLVGNEVFARSEQMNHLLQCFLKDISYIGA